MTTIVIKTPVYVTSETGEYESRVIGFELDEDNNISEVFTEYGSVPAAVGEDAIRRSFRRGR